MKYALIIANIFFEVVFLAILIFYGVLSSQTPNIISCDDDINPVILTSKVLALIYKLIYALLCITLTILLSIYSKRLSDLIKKSPGHNTRESSKKRIQRLMILSIGSCLFLILQTAFLIYGGVASFNSTLITQEPWELLFEITILELIPSLILCYMFGERNISTIESFKRKSSSTRSTRSRNSKRKQLTL